MISAYVERGLRGFDSWLNSTKVLLVILVIFVLSVVICCFVTIINYDYYFQRYRPCLSIECLKEFPRAFSVQIKLVKLGVAGSSFVALIFGSYLALRSYLTSSEIGAFGNRIAHIGLFERFVKLELARRGRLSPSNVNVYSIYRLMFPVNNSNSSEASLGYVQAVESVFSVVKESSRKYSEDSKFYFEVHKVEFIRALEAVHIRMDELARIDFLEVEDEVISFLELLSMVFSPSANLRIPERKYR